MNSDKQREIARKGGRAAHEKGTAHEFNSDEARAAGRKGGERVSTNRAHMAQIGRMGGRSSAGRRAATRSDSDTSASPPRSSPDPQDKGPDAMSGMPPHPDHSGHAHHAGA